MQAEEERAPRGRFNLKTVVILIAISLGIFFLTKRISRVETPDGGDRIQIDGAAGDLRPPNTHLAGQNGPHVGATSNETTVSTVRDFSSTKLTQIFEQDDICALEQFEKGYIASLAEADRKKLEFHAENRFLFESSFQKRYLEYEFAVQSSPVQTSYFSRFLAALRKANWLESSAAKPTVVDARAGFYELLMLAHDDAGNAAPAAFALAIAAQNAREIKFETTEAENQELINLIETATHFDSYSLSYARDLAAIDDTRAISLILRLKHLSRLATPNWIKFRDEFAKATAEHPKIRLQVTDLMMNEAKNAKGPSTKLSFNVLETAVARALAGSSRSYPTFREIDLEFADNSKPDSRKFLALLTKGANEGCTPQFVRELRDYVSYLKKNDLGLGSAL